MVDNPAIAKKWEEYCERFFDQRAYFKEPLSYRALGKGDINTFKLFLEQFFNIINDTGRMGIVVPSGIYTDKHCQQLREKFFSKSRIKFLFCFENSGAIFNIHRSFKFVLFGTQKGGETDRFKCAFMKHDPDKLPSIDANSLKMSLKQIKKFSPYALNLMEFNFQKEIDVASLLYRKTYFLGDYLKSKWQNSFKREFHMTDDSGLFRQEMNAEEGWLPLIEGKQFKILNEPYVLPKYWMSSKDTKRKNTTESVRVIYRAVARSTDERTFIATVIPKSYPTGNTVNVCPFLSPQAVCLAAIASTFSWDWSVRLKVTTSLNKYIVEQLPIPDFESDSEKETTIRNAILSRGCRLLCTSQIYSGIWEQSYNSEWSSTNFWYPENIHMDYGPLHEQEIRHRLQDEAKKLTRKWGTHCGVNERLSDHRDKGDRAQLRAEIDAYVAHLYGLSREDFVYILDTFPVLKKKEKKAFGEFMSKRKCLEEYDRLMPIIEDMK